MFTNPDNIQPAILSMALDSVKPRLYLLWGDAGSDGARLVGYVDGVTETNIVSQLETGYTMTNATYAIREYFNNIAWVPES